MPLVWRSHDWAKFSPKESGKTLKMQKNSSLHPKDILVVDDVPAICSLLSDYFEIMGHNVETASTAAAALELLAGNPFSLVITNMQLERSQRSGGLEVVRRAKQNCPPTPVIVISGGLSHQTALQLALLRADAFLQKPIELKTLHGIARELMNQSSHCEVGVPN